MKKTSPSKITAWIWRSAALLLVVYFLVAVIAGIPFFHTNVGAVFENDHYSTVRGETTLISLQNDIKQSQYLTSIALDIEISGTPKFLSAAAPTILWSSDRIGSQPCLHTDNLIIGYFEDERDFAGITKHTTIIGLRTPRRYTAEGELTTIDSEEFSSFMRSYSSPMFPVINTGSAIWGMLLLTAIPILLSFLYSLFVRQNTISDQKSVLRCGARTKLVFAVCLMTVFSATVVFYMPQGILLTEYPWLTPAIRWMPTLIRWLTPIITIPALSIWLASFKNKKLAPLVALGIMVLCLYQPLANLVCLFATVIAWGYFVEGIRRIFVRFKKVKEA